MFSVPILPVTTGIRLIQLRTQGSTVVAIVMTTTYAAHCPHRFVAGLRSGYAAVERAVAEVWINGMVEGHVNRPKLLKRQMYGRAKFDLLRIRV